MHQQDKETSSSPTVLPLLCDPASWFMVRDAERRPRWNDEVEEQVFVTLAQPVSMLHLSACPAALCAHKHDATSLIRRTSSTSSQSSIRSASAVCRRRSAASLTRKRKFACTGTFHLV